MNDPFKSAISLDPDWAKAVNACIESVSPLPDGTNIGFVYATDLWAEDLSSILAYLRQKTDIPHWAGTLGIGIHADGTEIFERPALAVMVGALPEGAFLPFAALTAEVEAPPPALRNWVAEHRPSFGLVHGDPGNRETPAIVAALSDDYDLYLAGGLTSSRQANLAVADQITGDGVSGVLFEPGIEVLTGLSQGCVPLAAPHQVTEAVDNVIIALDGRPAIDVLKDDVGELLARDLARLAGYVHAALPVPGTDTGDYMVRNLIGIDPSRGWLAIGDTVSPGDRLSFVRRDPQSARDDLREMLRKVKSRCSKPPKGAVYVSCMARGPHMFGAPGEETGLIREEMGDIPLVGFFAGGEISHNRLYGYTGVLTLFL